VVKEALVCSVAMFAHADGVTSDRADGQQEQSRVRTRTYEATQAPWLHGSRHPSRGAGDAGSLGRRRHAVLVLQTGYRPAAVTEGARALHRGGEPGQPGAPSRRSFTGPCPSLGSARPMLPERAIVRAPPSTEAARHPALRPRLERGDAPARGTRRGLSDGMAPWRHLTTGPIPRACRRGRLRSHRTAEPAAGGDVRCG